MKTDSAEAETRRAGIEADSFWPIIKPDYLCARIPRQILLRPKSRQILSGPSSRQILAGPASRQILSGPSSRQILSGPASRQILSASSPLTACPLVGTAAVNALTCSVAPLPPLVSCSPTYLGTQSVLSWTFWSQKARAHVRVCTCVCALARACVCVRAREREREGERERVYSCRVCVCVCVCERERDREREYFIYIYIYSCCVLISKRLHTCVLVHARTSICAVRLSVCLAARWFC